MTTLSPIDCAHRERYLLINPPQIDKFRRQHKDELRQYAGAYRRWIRSLPYMQWVPLQLRKEDEEVAIGIICILYIDQYITISFSNDMRCIRNEESEMPQWAKKKTGRHRPGIDKKEKEK